MMQRFILKKSENRQGWWVLADTENDIVLQFQDGRYNSTQQFADVNGEPITDMAKLARIMREMAEWMAEKHYDIAMRNERS